MDELKSVYEKAFGAIENCKVVLPQARKTESSTPVVETCFGFMNFKSKEDAKKAILEASKHKEIL